MNSDTSSMILQFLRLVRPVAERKWFIAAWTFALAGAMAIAVVLMPSRFTSKAVILVPSASDGKLGSIGGLSGIGDKLGLKLPGNDEPEKLLRTILNGRVLALAMVAQHRLDTTWGIAPNRPEDLIRGWQDAFTFSFNEQDALVIEFEDEDPEKAAAILRSVIGWVDSTYRSINQEKARRNLAFYDERILDRKALLDRAEDSMVAFQSATGTFEPNEQIKQTVVEAARLEAQVEQIGIQLDMTKMGEGAASSEAQRLTALKSELQKSLDRLAASGRKGGRILKELRPALADQLRFERNKRQILIHGTVYAFLVQQREMAALDYSRDTPVLLAFDPPNIPVKRSYPKRRAYVQAAAIAGLFLSLSWVLVGAWLGSAAGAPVRDELRDLTGRLFRWI